MKKQPSTDLVTTTAAPASAANAVAETLLDLVAQVPRSTRTAAADPAAAAREIAAAAARRAATTAGALALPPGPLGWLTVLPEMVAVWRIQAQMVADIAALYGRPDTLTREHMLYCLFKQTASQAVRDLAVRAGERLLVRPLAMGALQGVAQRIGLGLTQQAVAKGVARWMPLVGAMGVAAYAHYDTSQVARTAIALFEQDAAVVVPAE